MSPYAVPGALLTILYSILLLYIIKRNPNSTISRVFCVQIFFAILWSFSHFLAKSLGGNERYYELALFSGRMMTLSLILLVLSILHFALAFKTNKPLGWKCLAGIYSPCFVTAFVTFKTELIVKEMKADNTGYSIVFGNALFLAIPLFLIIMALVIHTMYEAYKRAQSRIEKEEIKLILLGWLLFGCVSFTLGIVFTVIGLEHITKGIPQGPIYLLFPLVLTGYAIAKYKLFIIEPVREKRPVPAQVTVEPGYSYFIKEPRASKAYWIFRALVTSTPGLCISTKYPEKIRVKYGLQKTPIIWLTETTGAEINHTLNPFRLEFEVSHIARNFVRDNESTVVLIDDIEYLVMLNGFNKTIEFLKSFNDLASTKNCTVIVSLNPAGIPGKKLPMLEATGFDRIMAEPMGIETLDTFPSSLKPGYSYLIEEKIENVFGICLNQTTLCISKSNPAKLRKLYKLGDNVTILWLSTISAEDTNIILPTRIEFELMQSVQRFIRRNPKSLIIIDCLELIIHYNGFEKTVSFIKRVMDYASAQQIAVVTKIDPSILTSRQRALLEKRFDFVVAKNRS